MVNKILGTDIVHVQTDMGNIVIEIALIVVYRLEGVVDDIDDTNDDHWQQQDGQPLDICFQVFVIHRAQN